MKGRMRDKQIDRQTETETKRVRGGRKRQGRKGQKQKTHRQRQKKTDSQTGGFGGMGERRRQR